MTVAEFVETALYHPQLGYYASARQRSGRAGDFFTSVDLGPLFGELLAAQFVEMWELHRGAAAAVRPGRSGGRQRPAGARHPRRPPAQSTGPSSPPAAAPRRAEPAGPRRPGSRPRPARRPPRLLERRHPDAVNGVIYANELLDALPPHLVVMRDEGLRELFVDAKRAAGWCTRRRAAVLAADRRSTWRTVGARLEPGLVRRGQPRGRGLGAARRRAPRPRLPGARSTTATRRRRSTPPSHAAGTLTTFARTPARRATTGPGWLIGAGRARHHLARGPHGHRARRPRRRPQTLGTRRPDVLPARPRPRRTGWPAGRATRPRSFGGAWR